MLDRRGAGEQVEGAGRQCVLVGAPVNVGAHQLFGRGVADRADRDSGPSGPGGLAESAGYPEVGQQNPLLARTATCQHDVGGFHIAMQQSALVGVVESCRPRR